MNISYVCNDGQGQFDRATLILHMRWSLFGDRSRWKTIGTVSLKSWYLIFVVDISEKSIGS